MFSSMAQNPGHFLRIFRVLHTVQFSKSFAADSSGRSRSQRQLWYSIISSAVCQQLFLFVFNRSFSRPKTFSSISPVETRAPMCLSHWSLTISRILSIVKGICSIFLNNFSALFFGTRYTVFPWISLYFVVRLLPCDSGRSLKWQKIAYDFHTIPRESRPSTK